MVPGPWPPTLAAVPLPIDFDPAGPLSAVVLLPAVGALLHLLSPRRFEPVLVRTAALWTVPGTAFLLAAAWFVGGSGGSQVARWLEVLPGGGGLVLSAVNLIPALLVGVTAPFALVLPEARPRTRLTAGWLLVLVAAGECAILAATPGLVVLGWMFGAWALYFLLGEADAAEHGRRATGPFVLEAVAASLVLAATLSPALLPLLLPAGALRLRTAPFHGVRASEFELLPAGAILLVGVTFTVTGLRAAHDGVVALAAGGLLRALGPWIVFLSAIAALWGGLIALPQDDLKRRIAGALSSFGALWIGLLAGLDLALGRAVVGGWALVALVTFVIFVLAYARLWAFAHTGDLRAYGGLGRNALVRSSLLMVAFAALAGAPFLGAGTRAFAGFRSAVTDAPLPAVGIALLAGGLFGLLGLGLAVYRTIRGSAPSPLPAPDLGAREWLSLLYFALALAFLAVLAPPATGFGGLWPAVMTGARP